MCPLCGRKLGDKRINRHHLLPKMFGGKEQFNIHEICHRKIHSVFTEHELRDHYHTWERLLEHGEIAKFVAWVEGRHPSFYIKTKDCRTKRRRR